MPDHIFKLMRKMRPMIARDVNEKHRGSTPLELLFDLVTVIAIASAAAGLHHAIASGHASDGMIRFAMAFFGIWWAWCQRRLKFDPFWRGAPVET